MPPTCALAMVICRDSVAAAAWIASSAALSWYLAGYAHYDVTYGSLGTALV